MLHYVHQLDANFVCLLFDVGQVEYSGVKLFNWKQLLLETRLIWVLREKQTVKMLAGKLKQFANKTLSGAEENCRIGWICSTVSSLQETHSLHSSMTEYTELFYPM